MGMLIKLKTIITLIFISLCICVSAQENNTNQNTQWCQKKEQFKSEHVAFLTTKLELSVEQAKTFWPIFNKYNQQFEEVYDTRRTNFEKYKDIDNLSQKEAEFMVNFIIENEQKELNIKKQFWNELAQNFPYSLVLKYFKAENDFRRQLIKKARCSGQLGKSYNEKN